jgi:hypothetical protein
MTHRKDFREMLHYLFLSVLAAYGLAAAPAEPPVPRLEVANMVYDAGELVPGPRIRFVFPIRNVGTAPLEITRVKPSCGCLTPEYDRQLAPGASGTIAVRFDTSGLHGHFEKHITVETNDPQAARIVLTTKVVLHQGVEVSPTENITLPLPVRPGEAVQEELVLRSYEKKPLRITRVTCSLPTTRSHLLTQEQIRQRVHTDPSAFQILQLTFSASALGKSFDETVAIDTNSIARPRITVRLRNIPRSAVTAQPQLLYFGRVSSTVSKPIKRVIALSHWGDTLHRSERFQIIGAYASDPSLHLHVEHDAGSPLCEVIVEYEGGWKPGMVAGVITIRTGDPKRPKILVRYVAQVSDGSKVVTSQGN